MSECNLQRCPTSRKEWRNSDVNNNSRRLWSAMWYNPIILLVHSANLLIRISLLSSAMRIALNITVLTWYLLRYNLSCFSIVLKYNCPRCLPFFFTHAIEMTSYSNHYFGVLTQDCHIKNFTNVNGNVNRENLGVNLSETGTNGGFGFLTDIMQDSD